MPGGEAAVRVVAAIIENAGGAFLIAERPPGKAAAGLWEFPGGKVEAGEDDLRALVRELDEELGIRLAPAQFTFFADARSAHLTLVFYHVRTDSDLAPEGREGQQWRWVALDELGAYPFPPANADVVRRLQGRAH